MPFLAMILLLVSTIPCFSEKVDLKQLQSKISTFCLTDFFWGFNWHDKFAKILNFKKSQRFSLHLKKVTL